MDTNQPYQQDNQTTDYSNQPQAGGGAPYQPPQQQQQPYGYQQAPPPPAPQKKGFNWLACCGITCLVLVIIGGGIAFCSYKMVAPFVNMGLEIDSLQTEVKGADISTIRGSAVEVDTQMLFENPGDFKGSWLVVTGEVIDDDSNASIGADSFAGGEFTTYVLENNVILMDVSNASSGVAAGDQIRAYGKCYGWDLMELEKMPFFGKTIADEMRSDPEFSGNTKMIFFMGKGIEIVGAGGGGGGSDTNASNDTGGDGWVRE
jgi:hypothetical protein